MSALHERLAALPVAALYEVVGGKGALPAAVQAIGKARRLAGPAFPVRCAGRSNLPIHRALYAANRGDVLVIAHGGDPEAALAGEMVCTGARLQGLSGIVLDGFIRDRAELEAMGFPVFCRGAAVLGPDKQDHPQANIGETVRIGGTRIRKGDFVRGDADGVVVLPKEKLAAITKMAQARLDQEVKMRRKMKKSGARLGDLLGLKL